MTDQTKTTVKKLAKFIDKRIRDDLCGGKNDRHFEMLNTRDFQSRIEPHLEPHRPIQHYLEILETNGTLLIQVPDEETLCDKLASAGVASDDDLACIRTKDLNRLFRFNDFTNEEINEIKKRRRILKDRGSAVRRRQKVDDAEFAKRLYKVVLDIQGLYMEKYRLLDRILECMDGQHFEKNLKKGKEE